MRWTRWIALVSCVAVVGGALFVASCATPGPKTMTPEEQIAMGRRLALIGGCVDCHTPGTLYGAPDTTRQLSGSELGWQGPWGVTYARNLTSDSTGVGSWTDDQIITAFREGRRPDGSPVLPPMPWPNYAYFTDEEAHALVAYLRSLPHIDHRPPDRLPPGAQLSGPALVLPPPPGWDAQNLPMSSEGAPPSNATPPGEGTQ